MTAQSVVPPVVFEVSVVAFDLDGTLVDTLPDLHAATNLTLHDMGYEAVSSRTVRQYIGQGIEYLLKELFTELNISHTAINFDEIAQQFRTHYAQHVCDQSALFPGIANALEGLKSSGIGLACLTNKSELFTQPILKKLEIWDYFQEVVCGDTFAKRKPDPLPLIELAARFDVGPSRVLMVGDSKTDTACARNAGAPVVCVPYGYRSGMALTELDCDLILNDPNDLLRLVRKA